MDNRKQPVCKCVLVQRFRNSVR
uniref:Uncharacterized protein n=1 Tax=Anopheles quadriannulatus TaxID=34691 RepID=A0A182XTM8_ANOQN